MKESLCLKTCVLGHETCVADLPCADLERAHTSRATALSRQCAAPGPSASSAVIIDIDKLLAPKFPALLPVAARGRDDCADGSALPKPARPEPAGGSAGESPALLPPLATCGVLGERGSSIEPMSDARRSDARWKSSARTVSDDPGFGGGPRATGFRGTILLREIALRRLEKQPRRRA